MFRILKRITGVFAALVLLLTGIASGEQTQVQQQEIIMPTATPGQIIFRFRDGIRWGMTPEQVKILEPEPMKELAREAWTVLITNEKVAVSRFTADLLFMFKDNRLQIIIYEFQRQNPENDFRYLTGALSAVYGTQTEVDPLMISNLMDSVNPNYYRFDQISRAVVWRTGDGTAIYQFFYAESAFAVMYVSAEQGPGLYQTNGL